MVTCSRCGQDIPEGFRFCGACGVPLAATTDAPRVERKFVSVLFVDLVGFTAASEQADPEDVQHWLSLYHRTAKQAIEVFGGVVEKFIGDAVMAIFGAPTSREDDAERAVLAGLAIVDAIDELNASDPRLQLAIRVGVNTGEAVVTLDARPELGEGMVTGDVVNTAARLQSVAPVGGVAVGELTHLATERSIDQHELEPVEVKGKVEPVRLWQALRAAPSGGTVDVLPLVGRDAELQQLCVVYREVVTDASLGLVTVTGGPGVGKSRLVEELRRVVRPQRWLAGRCLAYGDGSSLRALADVVKAHAGILETDPAAVTASKLERALAELLPAGDLRSWIDSALSPLLGLRRAQGAAPERQETFAACARYLTELARTAPTVVVFEDLHWADDSMLGFLEHMVATKARCPLLVLGTARPELHERHHGWADGLSGLHEITLSPLQPEETLELVRGLDAELEASAGFVEAIVERSRGNPLYAQELVRMLQTRRGTGDPTIDLDVPETVQAVIAARLDALEPPVKRIAQAAAVLGQVFWAGAVAALVERDERDVATDLRALVRLGLVQPDNDTSVEGTTQYAFHHALVRDVAYGQLTRSERIRLHRVAGAWIEGMVGERSDELADVLAHHFVQAVELGRASGDERPEDVERAGYHLARAGQRIVGLDVDRSIELLQRAVELLPEGHPSHLRALVDLSWGLFFAGRREENGALSQRIADLAMEAGQYGTAAWAQFRVAGVLPDPTGPEATGLRTRAFELLERAEDSMDTLRALEVAAFAHAVVHGTPAEGLKYAEDAVALAQRLGERDAERALLEVRGIVRSELGDLDGIQDLRAALSHLRRTGEGHHACVTYANLGDLTWLQEGARPALDIHREAIAYADERHVRGVARWLRAQSLWMLYDLGRWDDLAELANSLLAAGGDQPDIDACAGTFAAAVAWERGEPEATVLERAERALQAARRVMQPQLMLPALALRATVLAGTDQAGATQTLAESLELVPSRVAQTKGRATTERVRAAIAAGRPDIARRIVEEQEPRLPRNVASVTSSQAAIDEAAGDLGSARDGYLRAIERWTALDGVVESAMAELGAARCTVGDPSDAARLATSARATFTAIGATRAVMACDQVLTADRSAERSDATLER